MSTVHELRRLRHLFDQLEQTGYAYGAAGLTPPRRLWPIVVGCIICRRDYPVTVQVGAEPPSEPGRVPCADCNDNIDAEVVVGLQAEQRYRAATARARP